MDAKHTFSEFLNSEPDYFKYADADSYKNEIAELYSYTECSEFRQNYRAYVMEIDHLKANNKWFSLDESIKRNFIMTMIDRLEVSDCIRRTLAARCVLYLLQGCWAEARTIEAQQQCTRANVLLLYRAGAFTTFVNLLNIEIEKSPKAEDPNVDCEDGHINMHDSNTLRLVMNVIYIILETARVERDMGNPDFINVSIDLVNELINPAIDEEMFPIKMLNMMTKYCNNSMPHYPIKKVMLLLWKSTLFSLGGTEALKSQKNARRLKAGLPPVTNDTLDVAKCMQATILAEDSWHISRKSPIVGKRVKSAMFESTEDASSYLKNQSNSLLKVGKSSQQETEFKDCGANAFDMSYSTKRFDRNGAVVSSALTASRSSSSSSSSTSHSNSSREAVGSALLFAPKVRKSDIERFLESARQKFIGYSLAGDCETLIGLPKPILESVNALRRHLYTSLSELQIAEEERLSKKSKHFKRSQEFSSTEKLYEAMLPKMSDYVQDLLRLLQAASPAAKLTAGNVNARIIADMLPGNLSQTAIFSSTMKSDVLRHKEIVVKAVSAFLLLCVKHFKLNHIYHSEYLCHLMVQCNFIKQVLQSFAPSFNEYVQTIINLQPQEFPACVISPEQCLSSMTDNGNEAPSTHCPAYSWRNLFACVNLLRLLNKIVKWKPSRIVNMVFLKSVNTLKEALRIQQPLLQIYALKLLKMQAKFLGRNWRRHNLKVLTAIYTKVRPRFNDDWAYGCKTVGDFWGAQEDEMEAFENVKEYHLRRFPYLRHGGLCSDSCNGFLCLNSATADLKRELSECPSAVSISQLISSNKIVECNKSMRLPLLEANEFEEPTDNSDEDLPEDFKKNYETWLENQVFNGSFDWDSI